MALIRRMPRLTNLPELFDWPDWADWSPAATTQRLRMEEYTEDGDLVIRAEMPGVDPEQDIEISLEDDILHIHAERREETKGDEEGRKWSEFRYGSYSRALRMPPNVTEADIRADYSDGILEVRVPLPSPEKAEPKQITVTRKS